MVDTVVVGSWVSVRDGCEIACDVGGPDAVMIALRGEGQPFELFFQACPLGQLVERAPRALAEMDAMTAESTPSASSRNVDVVIVSRGHLGRSSRGWPVEVSDGASAGGVRAVV